MVTNSCSTSYFDRSLTTEALRYSRHHSSLKTNSSSRIQLWRQNSKTSKVDFCYWLLSLFKFVVVIMRRPTTSSSYKQDRILPRILRRSTRFEAVPEDARKEAEKPTSPVPQVISDAIVTQSEPKLKNSKNQDIPEIMKAGQMQLSSNKNKVSTNHVQSGPSVNRRRYCCPRCSYSTDRRDLFTRHENIHRDEKPFRCYICNKMFNRADHVKKHFLRIHKGVDYDAKLTKRIKGIDYETDDGLQFEPLDKTLKDKIAMTAPLQDINGNNVNNINPCYPFKANLQEELRDRESLRSDLSHVPVTNPSILTRSGPTLLSSELMSRILEGNQLLSKQSVQNIAAVMNPTLSLQVSTVVSNPVTTMSAISAAIGSSASNLSALFPLDSVQMSKPLFVSGTDLTKWPKMQEVTPHVSWTQTSANRPKETPQPSMFQSSKLSTSQFDREELMSSDESESSVESSTSSSSLEVTRNATEVQSGSMSVFQPTLSKSVKTHSGKVVTGAPRLTKGKVTQNIKPITEAPEDSVFDCDMCGCSFVDFPSLHTHRYLLHQHVSEPEQALPYECSLCHKRFPIQRSVIGHMNAHSSLNERIRRRRKEVMKRNKNQKQESDAQDVNEVIIESSSRRKQFIPRKLVKSDGEECYDEWYMFSTWKVNMIPVILETVG